MIHYQLRCSQDHAFDGWFKDSAAFDSQAGRGLVVCPACGDARVNRALMAPALAKGRQMAPAPPRSAEIKAQGLPDEVRGMLQKLRAEVERACDYVGDGFADEARRIHSGESQKRGIYGESTPEQAEALAEDGIEVQRIPWLPRADA